jgi:multicomponent Na+:H+ antiporter subunit B
LLEKTTAKLLILFIIIFGLNITIFGHLTPGGGFQGGAIIATGAALIFIVMGLKLWDERTLNIVKGLGGLGIGFLVFFGLFFRPSIVESQELFRIWSGDYILFLNIFCTIIVVSGLMLIIYAMVEKK